MTMAMFATADTTDYEANAINWGTETSIDIDLITVPEDRTGADRFTDVDFQQLVRSILANGLIHPIVVTRAGWNLISGLNRLRAYRHITHTLKIPGYEKIPARTVDADSNTTTIVEAHENVVRVSLTDADLREMVERAHHAGLSRRQAISQVADQTGTNPRTLREDITSHRRLEREVEAAMQTGNPALATAAKKVATMLADATITAAGVREGRRIMAAAQAELTPPTGTPPPPESGATVTDIATRQSPPPSPQPSTHGEQQETEQVTSSQRAWRRHLLLVAQEAAVVEDLDAADGAGVLADLPPEFQEQVRATVAVLTRVLAGTEAVA